MDQVISAYRKDCELRGFAPNTIKNYLMFIGLYRSFLDKQKKDILQPDKEALKSYLAYLRERGSKPKTIDQAFSALHSFYDFLIELNKIDSNPVDHVRKRYLRKFKHHSLASQRQCLSVQEASRLINSIMDTRDKTILLLLFKSGIRVHELVELDVSDIDMNNFKIVLKPTPKRSNRIIFFDEEMAEQLSFWLALREKRSNGNPALFIAPVNKRINRDTIRKKTEQYAARVGLHNPRSERIEDKFTPHCARHFFTTHLIRSGMPRDYVKDLRGDARGEAIDIYNHIDQKALRESYLAHIPQLGI